MGDYFAAMIVPGWPWVGMLAVVLGVVAGRSGRAEGSSAAGHAAGLALRLALAGLIFGGLLAFPFRFVEVWEYYGEALSPTSLHTKLYDAALASVCSALFGAFAGVGLAMTWGLIARVLGGRLEPRPRAPAAAARSLVWIVPGLTVVLGSLELWIADDTLVTGCSSGCMGYRMTVGSRVLGAVLALVASCAAAVFVAASRRPAHRRRRFALWIGLVLALTTAGLSIRQSYQTVSSGFGDYFRQGWLLGEEVVPAGGHLSGTRVRRTSDLWGDVIVVTSPDGAVSRVRLSAGPWRLDGPDDLYESMRRASREAAWGNGI